MFHMDDTMKRVTGARRNHTSSCGYLPCHRKVDIRLHGKENSKLSWRKAGQPSDLVDVVDSDQ